MCVIAADPRRGIGSCKEMRPCGLEAACRQIDVNAYMCICPQDSSQPTEDLKCKRRTGKILRKKKIILLSLQLLFLLIRTCC